MITILIDEDLCTRCGICSTVCTMGFIDPADENNLPKIPDAMANWCNRCGHCEAYCPSQALLLNGDPDVEAPTPAGAGTIAQDTLGYCLRNRRSVRHFTQDSVAKEKILEVLDVARYAASGGNGQPTEWLVVHNPTRVHKIAGLVIEWMKTLIGSNHSLRAYVPMLVKMWQGGRDVICHGAPHLLFAQIPEEAPPGTASVDAIIALTYFGIAAPFYGIGTCWAGFVAMAASSYAPLQEELGIPAGCKNAYAMMFGIPQYKTYGIPRRKRLQVTWG